MYPPKVVSLYNITNAIRAGTHGAASKSMTHAGTVKKAAMFAV
jgi:hypothetical protein